MLIEVEQDGTGQGFVSRMALLNPGSVSFVTVSTAVAECTHVQLHGGYHLLIRGTPEEFAEKIRVALTPSRGLEFPPPPKPEGAPREFISAETIAAVRG